MILYLITRIIAQPIPAIVTQSKPIKYSYLDQQKCKSTNQYNNQLLLSKNIEAYSRDAFYDSAENESLKEGVIDKDEKLNIELIAWTDDNKDALVHSGKALVCLQQYDRVATVFFDTSDTSLANPVRYQYPEDTIKSVLIQAVYMVPGDGQTNSNWQNKIDANLQNIIKAQNRIFDNKSTISYQIYPEPIKFQSIQKDFLTKIARGIVNNKKDDNSSLPIQYLDSNLYNSANETKYPDFFVNTPNIKKYDQITTLVYFEVGSPGGVTQSLKDESGYALILPALDNGNYFGMIGVDLNTDISTLATTYHEFMHTLGLYDEYAYSDGSKGRTPTHLYNGVKQNAPTLMENSYFLNLNNTYIDDQVRVLMGINVK